MNGSELTARALAREGVDTLFFLMGGPTMDILRGCRSQGIRLVDARHEQAAAMMAHAYARIKRRPAVCSAASGPGVTNLVTGVANAFVDCSPLVVLGGSSPVSQLGTDAFQELDQLGMMRPITKWAERIHDASRVPEIVSRAFRIAMSGKPGPVYLDLPGDVLYEEGGDSVPDLATPSWARQRTEGDPDLVKRAVDLLAASHRPLVVSGSGLIWSDAGEQMKRFVEPLGIPVYTTPQGRGVLPEDHRLCLLNARSKAFRQADLIILVGTRPNYVISHLKAPRFDADAKIIQIDIDPEELGHNRNVDVAIAGDAGAVLDQLAEAAAGQVPRTRFQPWYEHLEAINAIARTEQEELMGNDQVPIHPLRLCKEVRDFIDRDAILAVDGQEILNIARQSIPTYELGHRMNSGPFGTMGVGLPFGLGAKVAAPDKQVVVLHGDGSFGLNAMELDTAARHGLNVICVISLNGGWSADPAHEKPGRELGYTRFEDMARALNCYGERVESPDQIRPALDRAAASGKPAVVNVVTDYAARASTQAFAVYMT
jgi:thiamine pyrophosphate-dependent acetolactate synthase large subunit-like protein